MISEGYIDIEDRNNNAEKINLCHHRNNLHKIY